jgi:hypothetical protein
VQGKPKGEEQMNKIFVMLLLPCMLLSPLSVQAKDNKKEEKQITEVKPFDMQTLNAIHVNGFSGGSLRVYMDQVKSLDKELYQELNPLVADLELRNLLFVIYQIVYSAGLAGFLLSDDTTVGLGCAVGSLVGAIAMLVVVPKEEDVMRVIRKHNEILERNDKPVATNVSAMKLMEFKYSF